MNIIGKITIDLTQDAVVQLHLEYLDIIEKN